MDIEKSLENESRRAFLKKSATNVATFTAASVCSIIATNPFPIVGLWEVTYNEIIKDNQDKTDEDSEIEKDTRIHTNNEHFINNSTYRNLWVTHTEEEFKKNKKNIIDTIELSDIILLEVGPEDGYFDKIAKICKEKNKTIYYIDNHGFINMLASTLCMWIGSVLWIENILNHKELQSLEWIKKQSRRNFLAVILWLNTVVLTYPLLYWERKKLSYEWQYDISYIVDARTVFMLWNIFDLIKQHKWKKFLSITGDVHAKWFEYYIENKDSFELRKKIYSNTYWLFSSQKPKKVK